MPHVVRHVQETSAEGMKLVSLRQPFDRLNRFALRLNAKNQTRARTRPSRITLQAPQSPVRQPSLEPVNPRTSRSTSSKALARLAEKFYGFPVEGSLDIYLIGHAVSFLLKVLSPEC